MRNRGPEHPSEIVTESHPGLGSDLLKGRRAALQHGHRRTLLLGMGLAVAVHLWFLLANPGFEYVSLAATPSVPMDLSLPQPSQISVDGRPLSDASEWPVLLSNYGVVDAALTRVWPKAYRAAGEVGSAALRLLLGPDGSVQSADLIEGTGDLLKDRAFVELAAYFRFSLALGDIAPRQIVVVQPARVSPR